MIENNDPTQLNNEASPKDEEDIIELTDVVSDVEDIELNELDADIIDNAIKSENDLDKEIEIDHYLDDEFVEPADLDSEYDISIEPEEEPDELERLIADVVDDSQQETACKKETVSGTPESITLSSEQVDEALERVIKNMYADRIDSILTEVIEKTVTKEIEKLKALLLEDTRTDEE